MSGPTPQEVQDLRNLLNFAGKPTTDRHNKLRYDWPNHEFLHKLGNRIRPLAFEDASRTAKRLLRAEFARFRRSSGFPSCIEIVEKHSLDRQKWQVIAKSYVYPDGHLRSDRWYKNYKNDGLRKLLREWKTEPVDTPSSLATPVEAETPNFDDDPGSAAGWGDGRVWWTVTALAMALFATLWSSSTSNPLDLVPDEMVGRAIGVKHGDVSLSNWLPGWVEPRTRSQEATYMVVEVQGERRLIIANYRHGEDPGRIEMWDGGRTHRFWQAEFRPSCELATTHKDFPKAGCDEDFGVRSLIHTGTYGDLGDRIAAIYWQSYSSSFVVFYDIATGSQTGYYAQPGQPSPTGVVFDVNGDGRCELVLGGEESDSDRASVLVLDPRMPRGAGGTVIWNASGECALVKVLFPFDRAVEKHMRRDGLRALFITDELWSPTKQRWKFPIGTGSTVLYNAYLSPDFLPRPSEAVATGDEGAQILEELGLDPNQWCAERSVSFEVVYGAPDALVSSK